MAPMEIDTFIAVPAPVYVSPATRNRRNQHGGLGVECVLEVNGRLADKPILHGKARPSSELLCWRPRAMGRWFTRRWLMPIKTNVPNPRFFRNMVVCLLRSARRSANWAMPCKPARRRKPPLSIDRESKTAFGDASPIFFPCGRITLGKRHSRGCSGETGFEAIDHRHDDARYLDHPVNNQGLWQLCEDGEVASKPGFVFASHIPHRLVPSEQSHPLLSVSGSELCPLTILLINTSSLPSATDRAVAGLCSSNG